MKGRILEQLKARQAVVSGETLSRKLGVSRVAVWKHVKKLRSMGYDIRSTPKGYHLNPSMDVLYPWEFSNRAGRMHYVPEAVSTMAIARDLAREGCPDFTVVVAEQQGGGRGRLKRKWVSSPGGLYFTVVLRPRIPLSRIFHVNFAAAFVLVDILQNRFNIASAVKWPNDVLVQSRKIAGILSELEAESDRVRFVNVGIGINVNNDIPDIEPPATSVKEILGRRVSRRDLLAAFLDAYEAQTADSALDHVIEKWKPHMLTLNREVTVVTTRDTIRGRAVDIDDSGALIVELADGSLKQVVYGDCFHSQPKPESGA